MKTKQETIWEISKTINSIRKALGYAIRGQEVDSEKETIDEMIKDLRGMKKGYWIDTGGFRYTKTKSGIIINPKFKFIIKLKQRKDR